MMHFINDKNISFSSQCGFREGFCTEQAIVDILIVQFSLIWINVYLPVEFLLT